MERRNRLIVIFVIGTLLFTNIMMINKLNNLESMVRDTRNNVNRISSEISSINGELYAKASKEKLVAQHNYNVENIDDNDDKARAKVEVSFNKLDNNAKAYIMYKIIDAADSQWEKVELKNTGALNYTAELNLSYENNYTMQVMVQNDETTLSEDLSTLDLASKLESRVHIRAMPTRTDSSGNLTYEAAIENYYEGKEKMKMKSITCYVYYKNSLLAKTDIMQQGKPREIPTEVKIEGWDYQGRLKIEGVASGDFMKDIRIEVIAVDGYGKEYKNGFKE